MRVSLNDQISALHCHKIKADGCITKVPATQARDPSQLPGPTLKRVLHSQCWGGRAGESGARWSAVQLNQRASGSMKGCLKIKGGEQLRKIHSGDFRSVHELPSMYTCLHTHTHPQTVPLIHKMLKLRKQKVKSKTKMAV